MVDVENRLEIERKKVGEKHSPAWHDLLFCADMEKLFIKKEKQQIHRIAEPLYKEALMLKNSQ